MPRRAPFFFAVSLAHGCLCAFFGAAQGVFRSPQLAEHAVLLTRRYPVLSDNFPAASDTRPAAALVQTHESRISHHHLLKLREAHSELKTSKDGGGISALIELYRDDFHEKVVKTLQEANINVTHTGSPVPSSSVEADSRRVESESGIREPAVHLQLRSESGGTASAAANATAQMSVQGKSGAAAEMKHKAGAQVGGKGGSIAQFQLDAERRLDDYITALEEGDEEVGIRATSIRLANLKDSQYVGPLRVGSQGDILNVVYDTGSTNLWFASTLCKEGSCVQRHRYNPERSTTYHPGLYDLRVTFGTGELSGIQGTDDVSIGEFKVRGQTFALIQKEEGTIFDQLDFEGILGLAFPSMSANAVTPLFDQVMKQKLLQDNTFAFFFTRLPHDASAVFFGNLDDRLYEGSLSRLPVLEQYYWMVGLRDFSIGSHPVYGPRKAVFDSGTTYFTAPRALLPSILAEMPRTNCDDLRSGAHSLPDLHFVLDGVDDVPVSLSIKPSEYMVSSGVDSYCDPAWMPIDVPSPHGPAIIFGEAFMRIFFTAFHRGSHSDSAAEVRLARQSPEAIDLVRSLKVNEDDKVSIPADDQPGPFMLDSPILLDKTAVGGNMAFLDRSSQQAKTTGRQQRIAPF